MVAEQAPSFTVDTFGRLVYFKVSGLWTLSADLQWLTQTSEAMHSMRGAPWYLLADMRGLVISKEVAFSSTRAKTSVDRRNEMAECWWLNEDDDLSLLLPFKDELPFEVTMVNEAYQVREWLDTSVTVTPEIEALLTL